jgi:heme/copper-type cytochrome/quinol oxidase subunit 3
MSAEDYVAGGRRLGDVPRTTAATGRDAVRRAVARRSGPPAAWWGMAMFVVSEGVLFGAFVGTFFYLRFNDPVWPPHGDPEPKVVIPIVMVAVLSTTSFLMQGAWRAVREGLLGLTRALVVTALVVQSGYFAYEVNDYADQLRKLPVSRDAYSSIHYVLLGADHAHVFVGILFDVWLIWKLARGITTYRANALQAITWYTHFVNVLTWVVIGTITSAAVG